MKKQTKDEWKSKNIYWHKILYLDVKRIKKDKLMRNKYKEGQIVGFSSIQKSWDALNFSKKDITPYVIFKYIGKSLYFSDKKKRMKSWKEFKEKAKLEGKFFSSQP